MSRIRDNCNAIFNKYTLYNKKEFLQMMSYILIITRDKSYVLESEYIYMLLFYKKIFESVDNSDIFKNIIESKLVNETIPIIIYPDPYISSIGNLIDSFMLLLIKDKLELNDFVGYNIILDNNEYVLNNIRSLTLRGLVWKLLCCNLYKYLSLN